MANPRKTRIDAGVTQLQVAAAVPTSLTTIRLYEADPEAVSPRKRSAIARVYEALVLSERAADSITPPHAA